MAVVVLVVVVMVVVGVVTWQGVMALLVYKAVVAVMWVWVVRKV